MRVEELSTTAMSYAADLMADREPLQTTESRLKVLNHVTKLLEVVKTRESVVHQYHLSSTTQEGGNR